MGLLDKEWAFKNAGDTSEDITLNGTTVVYTKSIDTKKLPLLGTALDDPRKGYADGGAPLYLYVRVKTVGTAADETFALQDSIDDSTYADKSSVKVLTSAIVADTTVVKIALPVGLRRFIRVSGVGSAACTSVVQAWCATF